MGLSWSIYHNKIVYKLMEVFFLAVKSIFFVETKPTPFHKCVPVIINVSF